MPLKFAVAATVTGVFSLVDATLQFHMDCNWWVCRWSDTSFHHYQASCISSPLRDGRCHDAYVDPNPNPFYYFPRCGTFPPFWILAVVAGGIVHAIERDREISPTVELQVVSKSTWSVILYVLNVLYSFCLACKSQALRKRSFKIQPSG